MNKTFLIPLLCSLMCVSHAATVLPSNLQNGLNYWWDFDGNSTAYKNYLTSGTGNWSSNFGASDEHGKIGGSYGRPYSATNISASSFTVSIEVSNIVAPSWSNLFSLQTSGGNKDSTALQLQYNTTTYQWSVYIGKDFYGGADAPAVPNMDLLGFGAEMGMITLSYDGSVLSCYGNGVLMATTSFTMANGYNITGIQFGALYGGGRQITSADVDNVGIWNRALSAAEIQELYQLPRPIPEPSTFALCLFGLAGLIRRRH